MEQELYHHGIKGQRWGVRRYQNADGSLTPAGKKKATRYASKVVRKNLYKDLSEEHAQRLTDNYNKSPRKKAIDHINEMSKKYDVKNTTSAQDYKAKSRAFNKATDKDREILRETNDDFRKSVNKINKNYYEKYASRLLTDIKVEDTRAGRDYVLSLINDRDRY